MEGAKNKIIYLAFMNRTESFSAGAWRRLKKNKGAMAGLVLIVLAVLIAIFGYFLAPDPSPYANRIILEIGGQKPGFKQQFLIAKKDRDVSYNTINRLVSGKPDEYDYIPITSSQQVGDSIIVQRFIDEGLTERASFHKNVLAAE